jgi:hypothetical protein
MVNSYLQNRQQPVLKCFMKQLLILDVEVDQLLSKIKSTDEKKFDKKKTLQDHDS